MIFTHGIDSILRAIHEWTERNLPDFTGIAERLILKHNFKDGRGPVHAIPFNNTAVTVKVRKILEFKIHHDNESIRVEPIKMIEFKKHNDNAAISNSVISVTMY